MAESLARLLDNEKELMHKIEQLMQKQKEIVEQIEKCRFPYRNILYKTYIQGKKLVTVASEMGYDYKYICKQHGFALNEFDNTIKEVEKRH